MVPVPEAPPALARRKKGRRARRVLVGSCILNVGWKNRIGNWVIGYVKKIEMVSDRCRWLNVIWKD